MTRDFNYLSLNDLEGRRENISMPLYRMFEYTERDTTKRLENLTDDVTDYLVHLPTFCCSEIQILNRESAQMYIMFGQFQSVQKNDSSVVAEFDPWLDFGIVDFKSHETARKVFAADTFQLYRTHWAVRNDGVERILCRLSKFSSPQYGDFDAALKKLQQMEKPARPPHGSKITLGEVSSVEDFLSLLDKFPVTDNSESFFRGHNNSQFELTPSVLRKSDNGSWEYLPNEDRLCKEMLIAHYDDFQSDQYCFDRLVRMQHYRLPTRLLDISSNPLIALYFACSGDEKSMDEDGEVVAFSVISETIKYYDADTVSCLANLSNLTFAQKNELNLDVPKPKFNKTEIAGKLLHHIRSEKGYFEPEIVPEDLRQVLCVKAKQTNSRIKSQSGAFLLFGHDASLPESGAEDIKVYRFVIKNKTAILKQLDQLNINSAAVYPSIDQTASRLKSQLFVGTSEQA